MDVGLVFGKIAGLLNVEELKALCKSWGIKGFSGLKKMDLISLVRTSRSDEELADFISKDGLSKLKAVISQSVELLNGGSVAGEKLDEITSKGESDVEATFTGLRWTTRFSATAGDLNNGLYSCDCKASEAGGACVHFWVAILHVLRARMTPTGTGDEVVGLVRDLLPAYVARVEAPAVPPAGEPPMATGKPLHELLGGLTEGGRLDTALVELGLKAPAPKKARKAKDAPPVEDESPVDRPKVAVVLSFPVLRTTRPARIEVEFSRFEEDGSEMATNLRVLIDEASSTIAHEGCKDFDMRMARQKKLCKHLIQTFLSLGKDESLARHLLGKLQAFSFLRSIPESGATRKLSSEMLSTRPVVTVADQDVLKEKIMAYLVEHQGDAAALSTTAIELELGSGDGTGGVADTLAVMVNENTIEKTKGGWFKVK